MAGLGDILGSVGGGFSGSNIVTMVWLIVIALFAIGAVIGIIYYFYSRKQWNLKIEFKLPRSVKYLNEGGSVDVNDIQGFVDAEYGKGSFNTKRGTVYLKRKGKKKIIMKPFNITRYLQGGNTLTVVQVGAEEYKPVIPESFLMYKDDETGEEAALLKLRTDTTESKPWKSAFEREAKQAYSIMGLLREYAPFLAVGLVILLWGIQMLLLYQRLKG